MISMNEKMKALLKEKGGKAIEISNLCESIVLKTKCINDCILYDGQGDLEAKKINWELVIKVNKDWTGYEVSHNEILIPDEIFSPNNLFCFLAELKECLKCKFPLKKFCIIMSYGNVGTLRFHSYRANEGLWLSSELEKYENAVLYDL